MPTREEEINGVPPIDENGVDLSLIEYCLSLTPGERLRLAQHLARSVMEFRRYGGFTDDDPWQFPTHSTGQDF